MRHDGSKFIRLSKHASEQCIERGATEEEIKTSIANSLWMQARDNKFECKYSFQYNAEWSKKYYAIKKVRPMFCTGSR